MIVDLKQAPLDRLSGDFIVAEWSAQQGKMWQAPPHRHHECDEAWYVIDGSLGFQIDGEEVIADAGSFVLVEKGKAHTFWNNADQVTRYLIFMTPKTKALIDAIHKAEDRSPEALRKVFSAFDAELL